MPSCSPPRAGPTGSGQVPPVEIEYSGDDNFFNGFGVGGLPIPPKPGTSLLPHAPIPAAVPQATTSATFSDVQVVGQLVSGTVDCTTTVVTSCFIRGSLTVSEHLKAGKVVAVSASHKQRQLTKTVTIGSTGAVQTMAGATAR